MQKTRIAAINTHPIQYFAPLYAYLNGTHDLEVTALYLSDFSLRGAHDRGFGQVVKWDIDLLCGYPYKFVGRNATTIVPTSFLSAITAQVWSEIRSGGYDALWLHGHGVAGNLIALAAARSVGMPVLMRCESRADSLKRPWKAGLRKPLMSALYRQCDGFLAIGTANWQYYREMGVPEERISLVPYVVDNARFTAAARLSDAERAAVRFRYGIAVDAPVILFASKFQRLKNPDDLVAAAQRLAGEGLRFTLVLAGNGEMKSSLEKQIAHGGPPNVVMPGFVNQGDMPALLGACDVFVLPSVTENWGLIVNEAMCAGLPVVVSSDVGCAADLVRQGANGFIFRARDVDGLTHALRPILSDPVRRRAMSERSREIIGKWGFEQCIEGLRQALTRVRTGSGRNRRPQLADLGRKAPTHR